MVETNNIPYIQPSIEGKLAKEKKDEIHQIVQEINNFGISQRQIIYLIYQLALQLEERSAMLAIVKAVNENREKIPVEKTIEQAPKKKLIIS